jgi:isoleucyl-tRNA synthetase
MPGWVLDAKGQKMSKSLGNVVYAKDALEKHGADALRFYYMWDIAPYETQRFNGGTIEKEVVKFFTVYLNLRNYVSGLEKCEEKELEKVEDKWIMSKFNTLILVYNKALDEFEYHTASRALYDFVMNDLSRTYVKLVRDRVAEGDEDAGYVLVTLMKGVSVLLAPICPYIAEDVYLCLKDKFKSKEESVHLCDWLVADTKVIDANLEEGFVIADGVVQSILAKRDEAKINVRWPLASAKVFVEKGMIKKMGVVEPLIKRLSNVKIVEFFEGESRVELDLNLTPELEEEGFARELMRRIQTLRKEIGLKREQRIKVYVHVDEDLRGYHGAMVERCGISELHFEKVSEHLVHKIHGEIRGKKFILGIEKFNK